MIRLSAYLVSFVVITICFCMMILQPAQAQIGAVPPNGGNWWRNSSTLDLDFYNNRYQLNGTEYASLASFISGAGATYTRSSSATYFDGTGAMQTASANTPRLDYDPVTKVPQGLLMEDGRTNLVSSSNAYSGVSSVGGSSVQSTSVPAPDGSTMRKCVFGTSGSLSNACRWSSVGIGVSTTYAMSVYAKAAEYSQIYLTGVDSNTVGRSARYDLINGTVTQCGTSLAGSESITPVGNGVYRLSLVYTTGSTNGGGGPYNDIRPGIANSCASTQGDGTAGVYFWGVQIEQGSFPTSYIPTTNATVTRARDGLTIPNGSWISSSAGTIIATGNTSNIPPSGAFPALAYLRTSGADALSLGYRDSAPYVKVQLTVSGTNVHYNAAVANFDNSDKILAFAYDTSNHASSIGGLSAASSSGATPAFTYAQVGGPSAGTATNGYIKRVTYFPTRQPDYSLPDYTRGRCDAEGREVGGNCWYLGASNQSCDTVCSSHNSSNDATVWYSGSSGTDASCAAVAKGFNIPFVQSVSGCTAASGCLYNVGTYGGAVRCTSPATTTSAALTGHQRFCACNR